MCLASRRPPPPRPVDIPPPPPPPPPPAPTASAPSVGSLRQNQNTIENLPTNRKKRKGTAGLRIDLNPPDDGSLVGLHIPRSY